MSRIHHTTAYRGWPRPRCHLTSRTVPELKQPVSSQKFSMTFDQSLITVAAFTAALLNTTSVFAQEATPDTWVNAGLSGKRRAEVSTELAAARKSGLSKSGSAGYIEPVQSRLMHAQVETSSQQAIVSGEVKAINAEVYSFTPVAAQSLAQATK